MGTRYLIAVVMDGEYKVAQYGQWDGYPSGNGADILNFLRENNLGDFREKLNNIHFITDEDYQSVKNSKDPTRDYAHLSRDTGANILNMIMTENIVFVRNDLSFAGDSLYCEWAYVIDLDSNKFEIYEGFNTEKITSGRFLSCDENLTKTDGYEPVKMVKKYSISNLPDIDKFCADLENNDD